MTRMDDARLAEIKQNFEDIRGGVDGTDVYELLTEARRARAEEARLRAAVEQIVEQPAAGTSWQRIAKAHTAIAREALAGETANVVSAALPPGQYEDATGERW